jgi:hypothetical protein
MYKLIFSDYFTVRLVECKESGDVYIRSYTNREVEEILMDYIKKKGIGDKNNSLMNTHPKP